MIFKDGVLGCNSESEWKSVMVHQGDRQDKIHDNDLKK